MELGFHMNRIVVEIRLAVRSLRLLAILAGRAIAEPWHKWRIRRQAREIAELRRRLREYEDQGYRMRTDGSVYNLHDDKD